MKTKLCCVVNTLTICTLCNERWCKECWQADRTHGDEFDIVACNGIRLDWIEDDDYSIQKMKARSYEE